MNAESVFHRPFSLERKKAEGHLRAPCLHSHSLCLALKSDAQVGPVRPLGEVSFRMLCNVSAVSTGFIPPSLTCPRPHPPPSLLCPQETAHRQLTVNSNHVDTSKKDSRLQGSYRLSGPCALRDDGISHSSRRKLKAPSISVAYADGCEMMMRSFVHLCQDSQHLECAYVSDYASKGQRAHWSPMGSLDPAPTDPTVFHKTSV